MRQRTEQCKKNRQMWCATMYPSMVSLSAYPVVASLRYSWISGGFDSCGLYPCTEKASLYKHNEPELDCEAKAAPSRERQASRWGR